MIQNGSIILACVTLCCLIGRSQASTMARPSDAMLLTEVDVLTLYQGQWTTGKRLPPVPQLTCTSGPATCAHAPNKIQCTNKGVDHNGIVQWRCEAQLDRSDLSLDQIDVSCEAYAYKGDPLKLKGSCGLKYSLRSTSSARTSTNILWGFLGFVVLVVIVGIIAISLQGNHSSSSTAVTAGALSSSGHQHHHHHNAYDNGNYGGSSLNYDHSFGGGNSSSFASYSSPPITSYSAPVRNDYNFSFASYSSPPITSYSSPPITSYSSPPITSYSSPVNNDYSYGCDNSSSFASYSSPPVTSVSYGGSSDR